MSEQKRKKESPGILDVDGKSFLLKSEPIVVGSGYSLSITDDDEEEGEPVIHVKTYGEIDVTKLRREIKQKYPKARIEGLTEQPLILVLSKGKKESQGKRGGRKKESKKKELIRILDEKK
ncbi:MAG: hypothetical protein U9O89_00095 [Thermoproteota archaeon]|nr:hypothetical protein [Thermoproteota archaeon]